MEKVYLAPAIFFTITKEAFEEIVQEYEARGWEIEYMENEKEMTRKTLFETVM